MTDTPPAGFAPPEPIPVITPSAVQPAWAPPSVPPLLGPQTWSPPPPRPPRKPMSTGVLAAIVGGAVLVLVIIVVVVVLGGQLLGSAVSAVTTGPPLIEGDPAKPVALDPLDCVEQCFTEASIGAAISSTASYRRIGLTTTYEEWGDYESSSAAEEHEYSQDEWRDSGIHPNECYFSYIGSPVAIPFGEDAPEAEFDLIEYTGGKSSDTELSSLWQSVRVFDSSASAEAHMRSLDEQTRECTSFAPEGGPRTSVTQAPALDVPDSVAAIGWIEVSPGWRYYVIDVQRGNIVVRSILSTTPTEVTEQQFRSFVEELADQVGDMSHVSP